MGNLTGVGLYSAQQAAVLAGAEAREVRRWLFGYRYTSSKHAHFSPPLWESELKGAVKDQVGFRDLMELRIVKQFVRHGVRLPVIRSAIESAQRMFGTSHPLTTHRFLTDGRRLFHEAEATQGGSELIDVAKQQLVFNSIIRPALLTGIEFGPDGVARRWYPVPKSKVIMLDPTLAFGRPVLAQYGVTVETIVEAMKAEGNRSTVARLFDVPATVIDSALRFEERLAA